MSNWNQVGSKNIMGWNNPPLQEIPIESDSDEESLIKIPKSDIGFKFGCFIYVFLWIISEVIKICYLIQFSQAIDPTWYFVLGSLIYDIVLQISGLSIYGLYGGIIYLYYLSIEHQIVYYNLHQRSIYNNNTKVVFKYPYFWPLLVKMVIDVGCAVYSCWVDKNRDRYHIMLYFGLIISIPLIIFERSLRISKKNAQDPTKNSTKNSTQNGNCFRRSSSGSSSGSSDGSINPKWMVETEYQTF